MSGYVFYIGKYMFILDAGKVLWAAMVSFVLTWIITGLLGIRRLMKSVPAMRARLYELKDIMDRCHSLFPIDNMEFHGNTFRRGMAVKITLINKRSFKGNFVGINSQNMVCIITPKSIVTQDLKYIESLEPVEQGR